MSKTRGTERERGNWGFETPDWGRADERGSARRMVPIPRSTPPDTAAEREEGRGEPSPRDGPNGPADRTRSESTDVAEDLGPEGARGRSRPNAEPAAAAGSPETRHATEAAAPAGAGGAAAPATPLGSHVPGRPWVGTAGLRHAARELAAGPRRGRRRLASPLSVLSRRPAGAPRVGPAHASLAAVLLGGLVAVGLGALAFLLPTPGPAALVILVACAAGGGVAGGIAQGRGPAHGAAVWLVTAAAVVAADALAPGSIAPGFGVALASLAAAVVGGWAGARYSGVT